MTSGDRCEPDDDRQRIRAELMMIVSDDLAHALTLRARPIVDQDDPSLLAVADKARDARLLVIGGAGSIGSAVVETLARMGVKSMHVVDIDENGLADLVRRVRSAANPFAGELRTSVAALGCEPFRRLVMDLGPFDVALNFAALKHVRSERDVYGLARMIETNVCAVEDLCRMQDTAHIQRVFSVSSDKAVNPESLMGATKRWMEKVLARSERSGTCARFANVAFSKGSLPLAILERIARREPIAAPSDIRRYFITADEGASICLLAAFGAGRREVLVPRLAPEQALSMVAVAEMILERHGYEPLLCQSEAEARRRSAERPKDARWWPCFFSPAATSGEKHLEEFTYADEPVVGAIGGLDIVRQAAVNDRALDAAMAEFEAARMRDTWDKRAFVAAIARAVPELRHSDLETSLDERM